MMFHAKVACILCVLRIASAAVIISPPSTFPGPVTAGCGKLLPHGQSLDAVSNVTISSCGIQRSYVVFVPPTYNAFELTPLILSYHGGNKNSSSQLALDKLTDPGFNTESFVIYPQGINDTWQGVPNVTTNDVQFTQDILNEVQSRYCIDPRRIAATGKSNGGGFCNVAACDSELSKRISAFAPVSGSYYVDTLPCYPATVTLPCSPGRRHVPLLAFHGGNDTTIAYTGGDRKGQCLPTIPHFIQQWALRDGLGMKNVTMPLAEETVKYSFGRGHVRGLVGLIYESNIGHDWPSTLPNADNSNVGHHVANYNATPIILDFFKSHSLNLEETLEVVLG